jgi:glycolate oxidase iron-sulfur subunit
MTIAPTPLQGAQAPTEAPDAPPREPGESKAPAAPSGFVTADAPRWLDYSRCIHCGLCLNQCPTFRLLGEEMDSPRGRIYQVAQVDAGRLPLAAARLHLDRCLDCRACETACPSGVEYGRIIERARAELHAQSPPGGLRGALLRFFLQRVLPDRSAVNEFAALLRLYRASGLQRLLRAGGFLRLAGMAEREALAPVPHGAPMRNELGATFPARGPRRARVAFLAGCMQPALMGDVNRATIAVLTAFGCEVVVPRGQTCCGALQLHAGMRDFAGSLARRNITAFLPRMAAPIPNADSMRGGAPADAAFDAIVTNTAGCGSAMKEYGDLLAGDPEWHDGGAAFAARTRDISEFLAELGPPPGLSFRPVPWHIATYQDACHLAHGQRIRSAPRRLLDLVPALELREMQRADQCCGSAGIYNLLEPEIAGRLLADKLDCIRATGAEVVVSANPGCMLQIESGLRRAATAAARPGAALPVLHVAELLARSLGEESAER